MFASVNGTRIYFDVDGRGKVWRDGTQGVDRPVLLLLPGGPASSHMTYKNPVFGFDRLTKVFQVVYVDWRGSGSSDDCPPETMSLRQSVADVEALRELLGIDRWNVLGASAGGMWALEYASAHPERVELLMPIHCPATTAEFGEIGERNARAAGVTDEADLAIYSAFGGGTLEGPVEEWAAPLRRTIIRTQQKLYIDPDRHPDVIEDHQRRWDAIPERALLRELDASRWYLRDMARNYKPLEHAHRITSPTLVITGRTDPVAPPEQAEAIHRAIAGSELLIHEGGHMPFGDEQGPFWEVVVGFLGRHGVPGAELLLQA